MWSNSTAALQAATRADRPPSACAPG